MNLGKIPSIPCLSPYGLEAKAEVLWLFQWPVVHQFQTVMWSTHKVEILNTDDMLSIVLCFRKTFHDLVSKQYEDIFLRIIEHRITSCHPLFCIFLYIEITCLYVAHNIIYWKDSQCKASAPHVWPVFHFYPGCFLWLLVYLNFIFLCVCLVIV